ncbi:MULTISPECIES: TetR/AcrR family transcriptional regulator [Streptomyces]|uniref:TetR/AcrR family transcriptional regulator n=2 Tax=Streptomyces TaxID=1883 RepID=A0ABW1E1D2_9ACTN|nr:TetR/AcrR family transcriptional regulator [Streptomyces hirsutus]
MTTSAGSDTKDKLMRAAERLFAVDGVHTAQLRDIVRLAGQSNPSAVHYHFGSREGLFEAVMRARQQRVDRVLTERLAARQADRARASDGEADPLAEAVTLLVETEATELAQERGWYGLLINAQSSRESGVRTGTPHPFLVGTPYWELFTGIADLLARRYRLDEPVRLERLDLALTVIGAALADRARQYLDGRTPLTGERFFLDDLAATTTALLRAPLLASPPTP